jgi:hypothetical protein
MNTKKFVLTLAITAAVGSAAGCGEREEATAELPASVATPSADEPSNLTYADVVAHLEERSRQIGAATATYASMIGAKDGWRVEIDGHPFEIYVFEVETEEGQLAFTKVKNEGVLGFEAETYGNLAFFRSTSDPHPEFLTLVETIRDMH